MQFLSLGLPSFFGFYIDSNARKEQREDKGRKMATKKQSNGREVRIIITKQRNIANNV
jgi:hypothetical protein